MSAPKRPRVPYSSCKLTESNCRIAWQISLTWRSASLRTRRFGFRIKYWSRLKTVISKPSSSWRRNAAVYAAMPQSLLPVETMASVSLRGGGLATAETRSARNVTAERNANVVMCLLPGLDCESVPLRQMLAHRLHCQAANSPERERDQHDGTERSPPLRIERLLGQAWRHETGDENALSLGTGTRLLDTAAALVQRNARADAYPTRNTTGRRAPGDALWVYQRTGRPCRRCGTVIRSAVPGLDARRVYWCPACQPKATEPPA